MSGKSETTKAFLTQVRTGGHAGGRTARLDAAIREQLAAGVPIGRWTPQGFVMLSLDAEGQIVNGEPPPPVDPNLWRIDGTTGAMVNVADPTKRVQMCFDELRDIEDTDWFRRLCAAQSVPCDTGAQEAAPGVKAPDQAR